MEGLLFWWFVGFINVGVPAFVLARRLRVRFPFLALLLLADVAILGIAGGRRGWSVIWPVPVVWLSTVGIYAAALAASFAASPDSDPATAPLFAALVCGILLPCVTLRHLWQEACWETGQSDRWIWVAAVPVLGVFRSWPVAFRALPEEPLPRGDFAASVSPERDESEFPDGVWNHAQSQRGQHVEQAEVERFADRAERVAKRVMQTLGSIALLALVVGGGKLLSNTVLGKPNASYAPAPYRHPTLTGERMAEILDSVRIAPSLAPGRQPYPPSFRDGYFKSCNAAGGSPALCTCILTHAENDFLVDDLVAFSNSNSPDYKRYIARIETECRR